MVRKKTHDEFVVEVKLKTGGEYIVIGNYLNAVTRVELGHVVCGKSNSITPNSFLSNVRCPHCFNENKLTSDEFLSRLQKEGDGEYELASDFKNMTDKVVLKHKICGSSYKVRPSNFLANKRRCPNCAKNKKYTTESFKEKVSGLTEEEYTILGSYINSETPIAIKHEICGHYYSVRPGLFIRGSRCPSCYGTTRLTQKEFECRVEGAIGNEYSVLGTYKSMHKKVKMLHAVCGHEYYVTPSHFLAMKRRCPNCNKSQGEQQIANFLTRRQILYKEQESFDDCFFIAKLRFDFIVKIGDGRIIAIEYDGEQHYKAIKHWGGESALRTSKQKDTIKTKYCADNNIPLIRIPYWEYKNIEVILTENLLPLLYNADKRNAS